MANFTYADYNTQLALADSAQAAFSIFSAQVLVTSMTVMYSAVFSGNCWDRENILGLTETYLSVDPPRCNCATCISVGFANSNGYDFVSIMLHEMLHCCGMTDIGPYWDAVQDASEFRGIPLRIATSSGSQDRVHFADSASDTIMTYFIQQNTSYNQVDNKSLSVMEYVGFKILEYESSAYMLIPLCILLVIINIVQ